MIQVTSFALSSWIFYIQLEVSWYGSDTDSGIYDYLFGLSTTGEGVPDVLPFTSTHSHRHFHTYHAGLSDMQTVYLHIKAQNKAGLHTEKVNIYVVTE